MTNPGSNDDTPLAEDDRQRLVAYLDGELSAEESRSVESELAADEAVRSELQQLDRVWNVLDALPRATVDDEFTRSTVEMIAEDARKEVEQLTVALPAQRRRRGYGTAAACVAALVVGLVVTRGLATRNDRQVLATLPVIYQVDALGQFRDPEFLRQLRTKLPALVEEFEAGDFQSVPVAQRAEDWRRLAGASMVDRAAWVAEQDDAEKLRLQRASKRYASGSQAYRDAAQRLMSELHEQSDADQLFATAIAYEAWLMTHSPATQSRLRQINDPVERIAEIHQLYKKDYFKAQRTLTAEDGAALRDAIKALAGNPDLERFREAFAKRARLLLSARVDGRRGRSALQDMRWFSEHYKNFPAAPVAAIAHLVGGQSSKAAESLPPAFRNEYARVSTQAKQAWPGIEARLMQGLSPSAKQQLDRMSEARRAIRLRDWVREAAIAARKPDDATIEAYFASDALTDAERHELLALPTEQMKRRLQHKYQREEFGSITGPDAGLGGERRFRDRSRPPNGL